MGCNSIFLIKKNRLNEFLKVIGIQILFRMMKEELNVKRKDWNIFKNEPRKDEIGSAVENKFFKLAEKGLLVVAYLGISPLHDL